MGEKTIEGIDAVKNSVAKIEEAAASITKSSEQILNLIVTANMYEQKLQKVLSEIQSVSESTKLPTRPIKHSPQCAKCPTTLTANLLK